MAANEAAKLEKRKKTQAEIQVLLCSCQSAGSSKIAYLLYCSLFRFVSSFQAHRSSEAARQNAEKLAAKLREEDALRAALADVEEHKKVWRGDFFSAFFP
jgi:hypothetical protein